MKSPKLRPSVKSAPGELTCTIRDEQSAAPQRCKEAKVKSYGKLTVDGMRAALAALTATAPMGAAFKVPEEPKGAEPVAKEKPRASWPRSGTA